MSTKNPVIALIGHSRSGKDTAAEWLRDNTILRYKGGSSYQACEYVAGKLGLSWQDAWRTRHERKDEWFKLLNEYRQDDITKLVRACLTHSDIICGVRDRDELLKCRAEGLLDLIIWVDRQVPDDPTLTIKKEDCDIVIENNSTFASYYIKLARLCKLMRLLKKDVI
jgi:hypothetical protein